MENIKVIMDILEKQGGYNILGTIDDFKDKGTNVWCDYNVIGGLESVGDISNLFGGVVSIGDNWIRSKVVNRILELYPDFRFLNAVHPSSQIARDVEMGVGNVIMANTAINSNSYIGNHCIINTSSSVDHDNRLEDFVTMAPGAITGGDVTVGKYSSISLGAHVIHERIIGEHTVIGSGSTVIKDIPDHVVAYGSPAEIIRKREEGEGYL